MQPRSLVETIRERCRVCYTCVRECPAKAIRIAEGQAEVLHERCIGCGNCVRVCSQNAKRVLSSTVLVQSLLSNGRKVVACVAPSFPAEFADVGWRRMVGMIRGLGFGMVCEVGFGADLVARRYRKLVSEAGANRYIATTCTGIVAYVERYFPEMIDRLAPIVSPMIAMARVLRRLHGRDIKLVFIGPCIAKKGEAMSDTLAGEIDAAITFIELRELLAAAGIDADATEPSDFDPPRASGGGLFSISRGLLQAAGIHEDLVADNVAAAEGRTRFVEAVREFAGGDIDVRLLEVLCCNGCIMGAGMSTTMPLFARRRQVSLYVRERLAQRGEGVSPSASTTDEKQGQDGPATHGQDAHATQGQDALATFDDLDLSRSFKAADQRLAVPFEDEIGQIMAKMGKFKPTDELNCGACGYDSCRDHAMAIFKGLAETEMCLPYTIEQLRKAFSDLAASHQELATTQEALMQSEKLASMGQLAAGIAHEVNNPLGVVLMYAHLLLEEHGQNDRMREDLHVIAEQADRCKKIVAGLLNFARQSKALRQPTDLRELVLRTLKTLAAPPNVTVTTSLELDDPVVELDRDQIAQVLTNLVTNAYAAMPTGGRLTVAATAHDGKVRLSVADTGVGIPQENLQKIFEPFFTTKQIGKGTGLGLAVTYGIVKMHSGEIGVVSNADRSQGPTGSTFTVTLPRRHGNGTAAGESVGSANEEAP